MPREAVIAWMHQLALPLAVVGRGRAASVPARRRTPFETIVGPADVPAAFATGALLCVLAERIRGEYTHRETPHTLPERISGLIDQPRTLAAK